MEQLMFQEKYDFFSFFLSSFKMNITKLNKEILHKKITRICIGIILTIIITNLMAVNLAISFFTSAILLFTLYYGLRDSFVRNIHIRYILGGILLVISIMLKITLQRSTVYGTLKDIYITAIVVCILILLDYLIFELTSKKSIKTYMIISYILAMIGLLLSIKLYTICLVDCGFAGFGFYVLIPWTLVFLAVAIALHRKSK